MWFSHRPGRSSRQRGSVAVAVVAVVVLAGFAGAALVSALGVTTADSVRHVTATQAYYIADAGVEWACKQEGETDDPVSFGSGTFEVTEDEDDYVCVAAAGDARRTVRCRPAAAAAGGTGTLEYILGSREEGSTNDVEFLVMNTSESSITFNKLTVTWSPPPTAYFEEVRVQVYGGTNYGKLWDHDDEPGNVRWGSGETHSFTRGGGSATIPAHYTARIELVDFEKYAWGGSNRNMKNEDVSIDFYNGSTLVGQMTVGTAPN